MPTIIDGNDIVQELESFIGSFNPDEDVIDKMKELCLFYHKDASDLVSTWIAYVTTKERDSVPDLNTLSDFEREDLMKKVAKTPRATKLSSSLVPTVYNASTIDLAEQIMDCYETPERKKSHRKVTDSQKSGSENSPRLLFSPSSYSPSSAKYSGRSGKGDVLCSLGATEDVIWVKTPATPVQVKVHEEKQNLSKPFQYMFEKLRDRCGVLNDMIEDMAQVLQEKHAVEDFAHVHLPHVDEVNVIGRVCCDGNGKLNATSVILEGSFETSSGQAVVVDLGQLPSYTLFPGQIVAAKALNTQGTKLVLKSIFEGETAPFPKEAPSVSDPLDIVVAAGPFTTSDSLSYEPLSDLMEYVKTHNPDVLILIGPFVDCKHELIEKCSVNETYDEMFENQIKMLFHSVSGQSTSLVLVPSLRDIHHHVIYPSPPFTIKNEMKGRVFCASDPCTLNINGVVIGITSMDILFHLGREEISFPPGLSDRLGRLASHLFTQQSFYPLYPPPENVNIDYEHFETYGKMNIKPHILITPSDLRCFVKDVHGCVCINPERLSKGLVGGNFARIRVDPTSPGQESASIIDTVKAEVVRI